MKAAEGELVPNSANRGRTEESFADSFFCNDEKRDSSLHYSSLESETSLQDSSAPVIATPNTVKRNQSDNLFSFTGGASQTNHSSSNPSHLKLSRDGIRGCYAVAGPQRRICAGSILLEAVIMVGLIAALTPVLYTHISDRKEEISNINKANTMLQLQRETEQFLKDKDKRESLVFTDGKTTLSPSGLNSNLTTLNNKYQIGFKEGTNGSVSAVIVEKEGSGNDVKAAKVANLIGVSAGIKSAMDAENAYGVNGLWKESLADYGVENVPDGSTVVTTEYDKEKKTYYTSDMIVDSDIDMDGHDINGVGTMTSKKVVTDVLCVGGNDEDHCKVSYELNNNTCYNDDDCKAYSTTKGLSAAVPYCVSGLCRDCAGEGSKVTYGTECCEDLNLYKTASGVCGGCGEYTYNSETKDCYVTCEDDSQCSNRHYCNDSGKCVACECEENETESTCSSNTEYTCDGCRRIQKLCGTYGCNSAGTACCECSGTSSVCNGSTVKTCDGCSYKTEECAVPCINNACICTDTSGSYTNAQWIGNAKKCDEAEENCKGERQILRRDSSVSGYNCARPYPAGECLTFPAAGSSSTSWKGSNKIYHKTLTIPNGNTYHFVGPYVSWWEAESICEKLGLNLQTYSTLVKDLMGNYSSCTVDTSGYGNVNCSNSTIYTWVLSNLSSTWNYYFHITNDGNACSALGLSFNRSNYGKSSSGRFDRSDHHYAVCS